MSDPLDCVWDDEFWANELELWNEFLNNDNLWDDDDGFWDELD